MAQLQLRRYIWLIDTVRSAGQDGITFEEINRKWMRSILNEDGKPLPLRTFHDQRNAILEEFDIEIEDSLYQTFPFVPERVYDNPSKG